MKRRHPDIVGPHFSHQCERAEITKCNNCSLNTYEVIGLEIVTPHCPIGRTAVLLDRQDTDENTVVSKMRKEVTKGLSE